MVKPHCTNFRKITAILSGVRIFQICMVLPPAAVYSSGDVLFLYIAIPSDTVLKGNEKEKSSIDQGMVLYMNHLHKQF